MHPVPRTALTVAGLTALNVAIGRAITRGWRGLPAEHDLVHRLRRDASPALDAFAAGLSKSSDTSRGVTLGLALTGGLLLAGRRRAAWLPGLAMGLASLTHVTSSSLVRRDRPDVTRLGTRQPTSSFPSGHVGAMTALAVALHRVAASWPRKARIAVDLGAGSYLALLGWSRVYAGQHYATDVVAGYVNGLACAVIAERALATPPAGR